MNKIFFNILFKTLIFDQVKIEAQWRTAPPLHISLWWSAPTTIYSAYQCLGIERKGNKKITSLKPSGCRVYLTYGWHSRKQWAHWRVPHYSLKISLLNYIIGWIYREEEYLQHSFPTSKWKKNAEWDQNTSKKSLLTTLFECHNRISQSNEITVLGFCPY